MQIQHYQQQMFIE